MSSGLTASIYCLFQCDPAGAATDAKIQGSENTEAPWKATEHRDCYRCCLLINLGSQRTLGRELVIQILISELHHPCLPPTLSQYLRAAFSLSPHNSNLIAKVAAAKNAPLSLNLTNEHFSSDGNFGINPRPKLPDMAKGNDGGRGGGRRASPDQTPKSGYKAASKGQRQASR